MRPAVPPDFVAMERGFEGCEFEFAVADVECDVCEDGATPEAVERLLVACCWRLLWALNAAMKLAKNGR